MKTLPAQLHKIAGVLAILSVCFVGNASALKTPFVTARCAAILDAETGKLLYDKNAYVKSPPASTCKVMTAMIALRRLPLERQVTVSAAAAAQPASKAGLTQGASYSVRDLLVATLVSSSNDAAVALAEAVASNEASFAELMNEEAIRAGLAQTHFVNATGLTDRKNPQHSSAYDLARLMWVAAKDPRVDQIMGITTAMIKGSDQKPIAIKSHNKMLWRTPMVIKGKTGWTYAARHTFVGTNYARDKKIMFAMLGSERPWADIELLAVYGLAFGQKR